MGPTSNKGDKKSKKLLAIIFDVGDILYDASTWRRWLAAEVARHGKPVTYPQLVQSWEKLLVEVYKGRADYWEKFRELMLSFDLTAKEADTVKADAMEQAREVQKVRRPMPHVPETLQQLHDQGVRLVALSDTESGEVGVRKTLNQLGIEPFFDSVVSSFAIGHVKPEPEAFDYAIQATGHSKQDCGFVAHDIDELQGALRHNLFAIGYNYDPAAPADIYLDDFRQLLEIV